MAGTKAGTTAKKPTAEKKTAKKPAAKTATAKKTTVKKTTEKKDVEEVFISEADQYVFAQGTHYDIYKKLGAHPSIENGKKGFCFAVWAPNAASVHVIGSFNDWNEESHPMEKLGPGGIYKLFIPGVGENELYKYLIRTPAGEKLYKADPFANYAEMRPGNASGRLISVNLNGRTMPGWLTDRIRTIIRSRWQFTSATSDPG